MFWMCFFQFVPLEIATCCKMIDILFSFSTISPQNELILKCFTNSSNFQRPSGHFYCSVRLRGKEECIARKTKSILHDPHDLIEKNPIGQPEVPIPGTLGNWVHFHVLTVERDAVLPLNHFLKQLSLWVTRRGLWFMCGVEHGSEWGPGGG